MKTLLMIILSSCTLSGIAQNPPRSSGSSEYWQNLSVEVQYQNGYVFGTNNFLRGYNAAADRINSFQAFSLKISRQTTGKKLWEQLYKYPDWGIGLYIANFNNRKELGIPVALYGFFNAPFKRWDRLSLNYELGFGAAFNWKSFNPITNPYNLAIGAGESFFINAGLMLQYNLTDDFDVTSGFYLTHFSNGSIKKPNKGINTIAPLISLKYKFYDPPVFKKQQLPKFETKDEWLISAFAGVKNVIFDSVDVNVKEKFQGVYFPVFGVSTAFNRQISRKSKIGIGMTVSYNGSINAQAAVDNNELEAVDRPLRDKIQLSIYPSYELLINRVSVILQPAFYLYRKELKNNTPVFYQRVGLRYHFSDRFFAGITLRDYDFHVSDFIEWNLGYRIKWK